LAATGVVITSTSGPEPDARLAVGGSCFLFRSDLVALTAAHCVPEDVNRPAIILPRSRRTLQIERVERHPRADIAALFAEGFDPKLLLPQPSQAPVDGVGNIDLGEDFIAYGYPVEGPSLSRELAEHPIPRLFKGYYQRFMPYVAPRGYRYMAGEMSIPAPGGLSGSPLFREGSWLPTGLVTGSAESYAIVDSIEDVDEAGKVFRQESRKVITYGIALMLFDVVEWLNTIFPERAGGGWLLRPP
jgi:hypothetical protein